MTDQLTFRQRLIEVFNAVLCELTDAEPDAIQILIQSPDREAIWVAFRNSDIRLKPGVTEEMLRTRLFDAMMALFKAPDPEPATTEDDTDGEA